MAAPFASVVSNLLALSPPLYAVLVVGVMAVAAGGMYGVLEVLLRLAKRRVGTAWRRLE